MKIVVETDPKSQAHYYCFVAQDVASGDFAKGDYLVLPYPLPGHLKSVYLPDLQLSPDFWAHFDNEKVTNFHMPFPDHLISQVTNLPLSTKEQIADFQKNLKSLTIPTHLTKFISSLYILPTLFGTPGSFYYQKIGSKYNVYISQRLDFPSSTNLIRTLTHVMLDIQMKVHTEVGNIDWWKRQSIGDYLTGVLNSPTFSKTDLIASQNYLQKLCITRHCSGYEKLERVLSAQELKLWQALAEKQGQILSFDEAGDGIWEDDHKFSLYSIAKIVESLRKKMVKSGFNPRLLKTIRKRGYYLA